MEFGEKMKLLTQGQEALKACMKEKTSGNIARFMHVLEQMEDNDIDEEFQQKIFKKMIANKGKL